MKATITKSFQRRFAFVVSYKVDGNDYSSVIENYRTPITFKLGDRVEVVASSSNLGDIKTLTLKGKRLNIVFDTIILFLLIVGSMYCLVLLNILHIKVNYGSLIAIGFTALAFTAFIQSFSYIIELKKNSLKMVGEIVGYEEAYDIDRTKGHFPVIEYQVNGMALRFTSNLFYVTGEKKVGSAVRILVWKEFPKFAELDSFINVWGECFFWFVLVIGSLIAVFVV